MGIDDDTRAAWDAAPNTNPRPVAASGRVGISWHYDGGAALNLAGRPHSACLTRVKADQRFHQSPSRGWADIGYNLLVCQHGRVIEGRGVDLQGAHSPGVNDVHYGVQFMVGGSESPTPAALARAVRLAGELAAHSDRSLRQWGHRDDPQASTECPGSLIEGWVRRQGNAAPGKTPVSPSKPAPAPTPAPEDDMPYTKQELAQAVWTDPGADIIPSPDKAATNPAWLPASYLRETFLLVRTVRAEQAAQNAAMTAALKALATAHGADASQIAALVDKAVRDRLAQVRFDVTDAPTP